MHPSPNAIVLGQRALRGVRTLPIAAAALLLLASFRLAAQATEDVAFQHQATLQSWESVYVLGDLRELGGNNLVRSVRMQEVSPGNWRVIIRLPVNRTYSYQFYSRFRTMMAVGDPTHGTPLTGVLTGSTVQRAIAPAGKRLLCYSSLSSPRLFWRQDGGAWQEDALGSIGAGRVVGEQLYEAVSFGVARRPIDFYLTDGAGAAREPPSGHYSTPLDGFFLQDQHLFSYWPAASVSPHRRDYADPLNPPAVSSAVLGEDRGYRVILPRGYDEHTRRHYPVMYFHDGPGMFDVYPTYPTIIPIDLNGDTMARLVQDGQVGECIMVGIDWGTLDPMLIQRNRVRDYVPPGDSYAYSWGTVQGEADRYALFLQTELKPVIDAMYRTLPDPEHTWTTGFSFGGVCAVYLGWDHSQTFGRVGCFSASLWLPNFSARMKSEPLRSGLRIYLDSGEDNYASVSAIRDNLVGRPQPYIIEGDLRYVFEPGHMHSPTFVAMRVDDLWTFLRPAVEEANEFTFGALPYGSGSGPAPLDMSWLPGMASHLGTVHVAPASGTVPWGGALLVGTAQATTPLLGIQLLVQLDPGTLILPIASAPTGQFDLPLSLRRSALSGFSVFLQTLAANPSLIASNGLELGFGR